MFSFAPHAGPKALFNYEMKQAYEGQSLSHAPEFRIQMNHLHLAANHRTQL